jgi:hypothetical protein
LDPKLDNKDGILKIGSKTLFRRRVSGPIAILPKKSELARLLVYQSFLKSRRESNVFSTRLCEEESRKKFWIERVRDLVREICRRMKNFPYVQKAKELLVSVANEFSCCTSTERKISPLNSESVDKKKTDTIILIEEDHQSGSENTSEACQRKDKQDNRVCKLSSKPKKRSKKSLEFSKFSVKQVKLVQIKEDFKEILKEDFEPVNLSTVKTEVYNLVATSLSALRNWILPTWVAKPVVKMKIIPTGEITEDNARLFSKEDLTPGEPCRSI